MINLAAKLMISRALDEGKPPPAWVVRRLEGSVELRRFAGSAARLDRAFQATPAPLEEPPPFLATRVRAAIENADEGVWTPRPWSLRPLAGAFASGLALAGILLAFRMIHAPEAPPRPRHAGPSIADLWLLPDSPGSIAAALERPIRTEARALLDETRRVAEVVMARLPSPPSLQR